MTDAQKNCERCSNQVNGDKLHALLGFCSEKCFDDYTEESRTKAAEFNESYQKQLKERLNYHRFYESPEWYRIRYQAIQINGGSCQACGAGRNEGAIIQVDHIKPRIKFPELALDINNLQVLCKECNLGKSSWDSTDWRKKSPA